MEEQGKHTALPWTFHRTHYLSSDIWYVLVDSNGRGPIMDVGGKDLAGQISEAKHLSTDEKEVEANAKFIVEACNNYYKLTSERDSLKEENQRLRLLLNRTLESLEFSAVTLEKVGATIAAKQDRELFKEISSLLNTEKK